MTSGLCNGVCVWWFSAVLGGGGGEGGDWESNDWAKQVDDDSPAAAGHEIAPEEIAKK